MNKQQILEELSRLYCLQMEGKRVKQLIRELEAKLIEVCDEEMDEEIEGKEY